MGLGKGEKKTVNEPIKLRNKITFSPIVTQAFESKSLGGLKHKNIWLHMSRLKCSLEDTRRTFQAQNSRIYSSAKTTNYEKMLLAFNSLQFYVIYFQQQSPQSASYCKVNVLCFGSSD